MKRHFSYIGLLVLLCCFVCGGCTIKNKQGEKTSSSPEKEFIEGLTQKDTADFIGLTKLCLDTIKAGKIDDALNFIYYVRNDTLMPLTLEMKERLKNHFNIFPVKDYQLVSFDINGFYTNTVKYSICFREEKNAPHLIKFVFNPIWVDGSWYLTLKNN